MLTKTDYTNLQKEFVTKKEFYHTANELIELIKATGESIKKELKEEIVQFKDDILHEIIALREEVTIVVGYRDMLEEHQTRITKLEKKRSSKSN